MRWTWDAIKRRLGRSGVPEWDWPAPEEIVAIEREPVRAGRPVICLLAGQALCETRMWEQLSACLRIAGHDGGHVFARRLPAGTVEFYAVAGRDQPVLVHEFVPAYREPTRLELAEAWAWLEETTVSGREAVGR